MNEKNHLFSATGIPSLFLIFGVLMLVILSLLGYGTSRQEKKPPANLLAGVRHKDTFAIHDDYLNCVLTGKLSIFFIMQNILCIFFVFFPIQYLLAICLKTVYDVEINDDLGTFF